MNIVANLASGRDFFKRSVISFGVRILSACAGFFLSMIVGQQLGANEAGYFFLAFSIVSFLSGVSRCGFDNTIVRFVGSSFSEGEWGNIRWILSRTIIITTFLSSFVAVFLFIFSGYISNELFSKPSLDPVLKAMAPGVIALSLFTLIAMAFQGLHRVVSSVFVLNISLNLGMLFLLLIFNLETAASIGCAFSISSLTTLFIGIILWCCFSKPSEAVATIDWNKLLASSTPLWVVMLMSQLTQWSGQFIAGVYVPSEEVAQLAVAQRTALLASFILIAVNMVVAPRFAALYRKNDMAGLEILALMSVKLMVLFAVPIVAIMVLFPNFLMNLFGEGFANGGHLLQILAVGQFVNVVTGSVGYLLSMSGHEKDLRNTVLISGPLAIIAAVALTPLWGATGSAIATALAVATQNLVAVFWVRKRLGFNTLAVWR